MRTTTLVSLLILLVIAACGDHARLEPAAPIEADLLAARRAAQIERLAAYRLAGAYTTDERGYPTGVFRDAAGRHCPMAHLIHLSGRDDLVDETVRTNNRLQLADVHDGPLMAWMLDSGLTQEEIVMVQGIMNVYGNEGFQLELMNDEALIAAAREEVGRRLDAVLVQLEANTEASLEVAVARR